ncbi:polynucleotidyl transferase, ribonuclease H-like superfamily protein [Tasmannia lanceolata]|uniref:polynucleotidyl transferase, ribonuclease H-like superfamily protein n=1 Tax=Tasmannia lanceolata TaxID=3420 RepID=UPI004062FB7C
MECSGREEMVFFDLETTVPMRTGGRFWVLEFGAIVVCPKRLVELDNYCTLIRPGDLSAVALTSGRCHGITRHAVAAAPKFEDVADTIFHILNGRIWAGHNIQRFDCARIREAFADIGRPAPQPIGMVDSLDVLRHKFGRRAGNLKMATLATYFGLGQQKHRSLDDVRMNLEVLKHCATVLLLESTLPDVLTGKGPSCSAGMMTRSKTNGRWCKEETCRKSPPSLAYQREVPCTKGKMADRARGVLCRTHEKPHLNGIDIILKHSPSLLR